MAFRRRDMKKTDKIVTKRLLEIVEFAVQRDRTKMRLARNCSDRYRSLRELRLSRGKTLSLIENFSFV